MSIKKLTTNFASFATRILGFSMIWVFFARLFRRTPKPVSQVNTEEEKDTLFIEMNNYYKVHGMYCPNCGANVPIASICGNCGKPIQQTKPKKLLPGTTVRRY